jgi:hypothetical protein
MNTHDKVRARKTRYSSNYVNFLASDSLVIVRYSKSGFCLNDWSRIKDLTSILVRLY